MARRLATALALTTTLLASAVVAHAQRPSKIAPGQTPLATNQVPPGLEGIEILDKIGATLPRELAYRDHTGAPVQLADYLDGKLPVVLVLAYYRCPTLCNTVLNELVRGLRDVPFVAGKDFRLLVVSIDPKDDVTVATGKRASDLGLYGPKAGGTPGAELGKRGFDFLLADERSARALADRVGFQYRWDDSLGQYAHAAGAFVITPDGRLSRTIYGISFSAQNLRLALLEASEGKLGTVVDKVLMFCFRWDGQKKGYALASFRLMKAGAAVTAVLLTIWLVWLWRRERRRSTEIAAC